MTDVFNIGKTIRILANLISLKTLNEPYAAWNLAVSGEHFEKIPPLK